MTSLDGLGGRDLISAGRGDDVVSGGDGNDVIRGGSGVDSIGDGAGDDTLDGGSGDDDLWGDGGNDFIDGGDGNDTILAGAGDNDLHGGDGNDTLTGGSGEDFLFGEGGADVFRFTSMGDGPDHVVDFETGIDRIDLSAIDANTRLRGDQAFTFVPSGPLAAGQIRYDADSGFLHAYEALNAPALTVFVGPGLSASDFVL